MNESPDVTVLDPPPDVDTVSRRVCTNVTVTVCAELMVTSHVAAEPEQPPPDHDWIL